LFCDCFEFVAAQEMGTDNEGFCSIIFQYGDKYYLVSDFPAISYCPWCGKRVPQNYLIRRKEFGLSAYWPRNAELLATALLML
jgi:hypothetical protein